MGGRAIAENPADEGATDNDIVDVRLTRATPDSFDNLQELRRFPKLTSLYLAESSIEDNQIRYFQGLQQLTILNLADTRVGDAGFQELRTLPRLRHLVASQTRITDSGLERLAALKSLRKLFLNHTKVTDSGIGHLAQCNSLEVLALEGCVVHGSGFESLTESAIEYLFLNDSELTDLSHIGALKSLGVLEAQGCRLNDDSLIALRAAPQLSILYLEDNQLTDACLPHLEAIPNLMYVCLGGTEVTAEGARAVKIRRPNLEISLRPRKRKE